MKSTAHHDDKIAALGFSSVFQAYLNKIEKKNRTRAELIQVITWLTGYNEARILELANSTFNMRAFFDGATLNPDASLIKGSICGYRVEEISNPLTQKVRYLDKLVDELAKGWEMNKVLRMR